MDSIKIIKKHGQPGGMPVVTVYVDEDAPGETKPIYRHRITRTKSSYSWSIDIFNDDPTAFTAASLAKWLKDNGYTSYGVSGYPIQQIVINYANGSLQTQETLFSSNGTTISMRVTTYSPVINESALTYTQESVTTTLSTIYDAVSII